MKEIITNYLKNNYSIELRAEKGCFSAKELKTYRDNLISAIAKYWDAPTRMVGRSFFLHKKVHKICSDIFLNNRFDIQGKAICDNTNVVVFWP